MRTGKIRLIVVLLLVVVMSSTALGANWIKAYLPDSFAPNTAQAQYKFKIQRTCDDPDTIMGVSNGFKMYSTGAATWTWGTTSNIKKDPATPVIWNTPSFQITKKNIDNVSPDTFLVGGAASDTDPDDPENLYGMQIHDTDQPYVYLEFAVGAGEGSICFDSCYVPPAGPWKWVQMNNIEANCTGVVPQKPQFVNQAGTEAPFCVPVIGMTYGPPRLTNPLNEDKLMVPFGHDTSYAFVWEDTNTVPQTPLVYAIVSGEGAIDGSGNYTIAAHDIGVYNVTISCTNAAEEVATYSFVVEFENHAEDITDGRKLPEAFSVDQNYPNPFNPTTIIRFSIPTKSFVNLSVFNVMGQEVATLVNEEMDAGYKQVSWDGVDHTGASVASGVYFYKITAKDYVESKKMLLLK